ncbi:arylsulfatase H-like [Ptychodera flava]|uniref:arylsulfatase H-like n=1 Tax=Ptychodera flava TaxID=63121 RepID=UPI00396A848A
MASHCGFRLLLFFLAVAVSFAKKTTNPNIVMFLVDDLGYGDLSCYGNETLKTPNIDRLASEGLKFTRMYSQSSCTPSRAALLTGRYPIRSGMLKGWLLPFHGPSSPAQTGGLPENEYTLAEMLKQNGYATGILGKWHLGFGSGGKYLPTRQGFDYFYGIPMTHIATCEPSAVRNYSALRFLFVYISFTYKLWGGLSVGVVLIWVFSFIGKKALVYLHLIMLLLSVTGYYILLDFSLVRSQESCLLMRNDDIIEQPYKAENMTLKLTQEALLYLSEHGNNPFFLMISYLTLHSPVFSSKYFEGRSGIGRYGDALMELDWSVGQVLQQLKKQGLEENTMIIFLSDNGPFIFEPDGVPTAKGVGGSTGVVENSGGELVRLRGGKGGLFEGGVRIPGIIRLDGVIPPNTESRALVSLNDIFPTVADILNLTVIDRIIDGKSLLPLLRNPTEITKHHDHLLFYCTTKSPPSMLVGKYKIHYINPFRDGRCDGDVLQSPIVYDLTDDPGEQYPLPAEETQEVRNQATEILARVQTTLPESLSSQLDSLILPWLFPCANFPYCRLESDVEDEFGDLQLPEIATTDEKKINK